jgi:hypothetical protein
MRKVKKKCSCFTEAHVYHDRSEGYLLARERQILLHLPIPFWNIYFTFLIKEPSGLLILSTSNPNAVADIASKVKPPYNLYNIGRSFLEFEDCTFSWLKVTVYNVSM